MFVGSIRLGKHRNLWANCALQFGLEDSFVSMTCTEKMALYLLRVLLLLIVTWSWISHHRSELYVSKPRSLYKTSVSSCFKYYVTACPSNTAVDSEL